MHLRNCFQFIGPRIPDTSNEKASRALLPLLTCHQINEEARLIAFSRTIFHVPNIATSLRPRLQTLSSQLLGAVRYLTITLNISLEPSVFDIPDSPLPDMGLEQPTLIIRKSRPVESNRGPESDLSYLPRVYPDIIVANSIRFEINYSRDLKHYICRAPRPSKVKRFSILHDGCCRSTQFAKFSRALETVMKSPEHNSDYWDVSLHAERNCIELVSMQR